MPSARKQRVLKKRESHRGLYVLGVVVIAIVLAGIGWYLYASAQSANSPAIVYAKLNTSMGLIEVELYQSKTPKTVANFVSLARSGFYDNLVWHRIVPGFVIQTGDPYSKNGLNNSTWGQGQSSPTVPLEIDPSLHNQAGYMAMAHLPNNDNSGSCQFFINLVDNSASLDGGYTVFGRVIVGMNDVVPRIASVPTYTSQQPITLVFLNNVSISNNP